MIFKNLKNSFLFFGLSTALVLGLSPAAQAQRQAQAQPGQDFITLSGNASYLQRIAMPPEAVLTVQVQDVTRPGTHGAVLSESREVFGQRQVPLAYSVMVARSAINPRKRYARSGPVGQSVCILIRPCTCTCTCAIGQVCLAGHVCRRAALRRLHGHCPLADA